MVHVDQSVVRNRRGWRARTFWLFPLALMLLTLVLTWTVDQLNDRRDVARQQQLVLTEIESDFGTLEIVGPLAIAPGAPEDERDELEQERGDIDAGVQDLGRLSEGDPVVTRLTRSWQLLEQAYDTGESRLASGDLTPGFYRDRVLPTYDDFDVLLDQAQETFEQRAVDTANS